MPIGVKLRGRAHGTLHQVQTNQTKITASEWKTPYERHLELEKGMPIQPDVTLEYWAHYEEILPRNAAYLYRSRRKSQR